MIGVSLPYKDLVAGRMPGGAEGSLPTFLHELRESGADSIELRGVGRSPAPADMLAACRAVWACGMTVTLHGDVRSAGTAVSDVFDPLVLVLPEIREHQPLLSVTIHPIPGDEGTSVTDMNVRMVNALSDHILTHGLPVRIALENNRKMPDKSMGDSAALVSDVIGRVRARLRGDARVGDTFRSGVNCVAGICFDMGHYAWYRDETAPGEAYVPPDEDFIRYVIHTHIHAVSPGGQTHFPLTEDNYLPLRDNLEALGHRFGGQLNLELSFDRFKGLWTPGESLSLSLSALKAAITPLMRTYYDVRAHFIPRMEAACSLLSDKPGGGTRFALVQSTFYVFDTAGTKWVMDPALRLAADITAAPDRIADCLRGADYVLITHGHSDHFDGTVVRRLAGSGIRWVIPAFLLEEAAACGLSDREIIPAEPGQTLQLGSMTVQVFEGRHYRPGTQNGVPEIGYRVTAPGSPSLLFPGDIRDYAPDGFSALTADVVFGHVWLGDGNCLDSGFPLADDFVRLFSGFSARRVLLTHLYEAGRSEKTMWRRRHAELLAARFAAVSPGIRVDIPFPGQIMEL